MASQTSFQKKSRIPYIPGSRPSVQNSQLLISSGVPSFDCVIGGGIPVGTIVLVEEDTYGTFAKLLLKYFLAEGAVSGHDLLFASQDIDPEHLIQELPSPVTTEQGTSRSDVPEENMTIAWRYQNLRVIDTAPSGLQIGHNFDLTKSLDPSVLKGISVSCWSGCFENNEVAGNENLYYADLLKHIKNCMKQYEINSSTEKRNILRVAIHCLGSPLWEPASSSELIFFFYALRAVLRSAYAVCMVSIPSHLFEEASLYRCQHISDVAVKLESFAGSDKETNPVFKDYHGLFHINKLAAINTLAPYIPESFDLAFKLRRKKFVIEKLHLPPELQETTQREQDDVPTVGCGAPQKKLLDF